MALNALVGGLSWDVSHTAGTTYTINLGAGFDPKWAMFWIMGQASATDAVQNQDVDCSVGLATGIASRRCAALFSDDALASSSAFRTHRSDSVLAQLKSIGIVGLLDVTTWASNQIILTVDDQANNTCRVSYLIVGGSDIGNVSLFDITSPTSTGVQSYTTPGFQPTGALFLTPGFSMGNTPTPALNNTQTQAQMMLGCATGTGAGDQWVLAATSRHSQAAADTFGYGIDGECVATMQAAGTIFEVASLQQFDADGLDLNWTTITGGGATNNTLISCLCWDGAQSQAGSFLSETSITAITEAVGFQPSLAAYFSALRPKSTTLTTTAQAALSIGATDGTNSRAQAYLDLDAADPTDITVAVDFDKVYMDLSDATVDGLIGFSSFNASPPEMTLDQTDADPAQNFVPYLALGVPAAAAIDNDQLAMMGFAASAGGRLPWMW